MKHAYYLSTTCEHGLHDLCGAKQHERGDTSDAHCKHCSSPCRCPYPNHKYPHANGMTVADRVHTEACVLPPDHLGWCGEEEQWDGLVAETWSNPSLS